MAEGSEVGDKRARWKRFSTKESSDHMENARTLAALSRLG
uniref:Uncharacterized protein n=2 Tax=Vibrio TaxID=662 RepID=A0A0H3ZQB4_9VIBR|nr:hypothetical protein [Vibrio tasmaniensis]AKN40828.1 hypothetical protein [Vibrio sp. 1F_189]